MKKFIRSLIITAVVLAIGFYIEVDYYLLSPSRAVDLGQIVTVEDSAPTDWGTFYLVTVSQSKANLLTAAYGYIHPHMELRPADAVLLSDMDEREYRELLREYMVESQHMAQLVALNRLGYDVDIVSEGVRVVAVMESEPADGYLVEDDLINAIDGRPVFLASEVPLMVQDRQVGDMVELTVTRKDSEILIQIPTGPSPEDVELPFLGIYIQTLPWEPVIPIEIIMDTGGIGGPSAGLMFVLEMINQLTEEDLTAGFLIAGTGTINFNESVGRVGGIPQKVIAAERAGAEYFFVPAGNYEQAESAAKNIEVIPVENLEDALTFLEQLQRERQL